MYSPPSTFRGVPGATGRFHDHFGNLNGRWSWEDPKDVLLYGCDSDKPKKGTRSESFDLKKEVDFQVRYLLVVQFTGSKSLVPRDISR